MANQGTFTAGQVLTAAELNGFTQVTALFDSSAVSVPSTSAFVVPYGSGTELVDVGGWHSTSTNTGRITPNVNGVYLLTTSMAYNYISTAQYFEIVLRKNSVVSANSSLVSGYFPAVTTSLVVTANGTTDYFDTYAYHEAASAVNTFRQDFSCTLLRAL